ncbi:MAG: hypothetical protein AAF633_25185 [Chloroflexota bacterium]
MFCPTCQKSNLYLDDRCQHCQTDLGLARQHTHIGAQFVYFDASTEIPIVLKVDGEIRTVTEPTIVSRYEHGIELYDLSLIEES